jgi:ERF superfamily
MATQTEALVPVQPDSMLAIIERAVMSPDFDINKLQTLLELRERWDKNEARKAFVKAMNAFKEHPPEITKNKQVAFGQTKYNHATLDHVCDAVTKGLSEHGISHRWQVAQEKEWITVTCILTHEMGHYEETKLMGCADNSGSKNPIQAVGSTVTYLERYTLLAATGLAAANTDTDGRVPQTIPSAPTVNVEEKLEWIANAANLDELKRLYTNAYREAELAKDRSAMARYLKAKDARKAQL